jgi:hypothetical protein
VENIGVEKKCVFRRCKSGLLPLHARGEFLRDPGAETRLFLRLFFITPNAQMIFCQDRLGTSVPGKVENDSVVDFCWFVRGTAAQGDCVCSKCDWLRRTQRRYVGNAFCFCFFFFFFCFFFFFFCCFFFFFFFFFLSQQTHSKR